MRQRSGDEAQHKFHDHAEVREIMIGTALADSTDPMVVSGDSITEMAPLFREMVAIPPLTPALAARRSEKPRA